MESALAQPFVVGNAIKSWFGLFNLFLKANQIIIAENLHASTFSYQLQIIPYSHSTIFLLVER